MVPTVMVAVVVMVMVMEVEAEPPTSASGPEVVSGLLTFQLKARNDLKPNPEFLTNRDTPKFGVKMT